ncbi:MAG: hypothetical protein IKG42_03210 [Clostridia bacterium]|nr:hypothetical protein [Clostridia bacterium]
MKVSWIKSSKDSDSFNLMKNMGFRVVELDDLDEVDDKIKGLIGENYNTFFVTNEVAGFSEDIMKRYCKSGDIRIIITPARRRNDNEK